MKLEAKKWYITKGGYLVHIDYVDDDIAKASIETSPGTNKAGHTVQKVYHNKQGWNYSTTGSINLSADWDEKLTIVKEYPCPVKLPDGYEWKDGYPKLYEYKQLDPDDCFISSSGFPSVAKQTSSFGSVSVLGDKRIGLVKKEVAPVPTKLQLAVGKWYVTAGDYLVNITDGKNGKFIASLETSPGVDINGELAKDIVPKNDGWSYKSDGEVYSHLYGKWVNDLKIVAEYPHPINLPSQYEWKDGFPKLLNVKDCDEKDLFLSTTNGTLSKNSYIVNDKIIGVRRIGIVEKEKATPESKLQLAVGKWYITKGGYLVYLKSTTPRGNFVSSVETSPGVTLFLKTCKQQEPCHEGWYYNPDGLTWGLTNDWIDKLTIVAEYPYPVNLPEKFEWKGGFPKLYEANELSYEECYLERSGNISPNTEPRTPFLQNDLLGRKRVGLVKNKSVKSPVPVPIESETMKKETAVAVAKTAANLGFRALNYWFFEPAVNVFRPVVKGVRYAVFLGTIASIGYGYKHPDMVKDAIMSCLPKVSIEAPEILR